MLKLYPSPTAPKTPAVRLFEPIESPTLEGLRDELVAFALKYRVDISERFSDQIYAVRPWNLDEGEQAPTPREVTSDMVYQLAGQVLSISPGKVTIEGHIEN